MEKVTNSPLGLKFVRQSDDLTAIDKKLRREKLSPNRRAALTGQREVVVQAISKTLAAISGPSHVPFSS